METRTLSTLAAVSLLLSGAPAATGQEAPSEPWCAYPRPDPRRAFPSRRPHLMQATVDVEPNDSRATAQRLPLGRGPAQDLDVDVVGTIEEGDVDVFVFDVEAGDTLGAACLADRPGGLDSVLTVLEPDGEPRVVNEQHGGLGDLYPPGSPFPVGASRDDSALTVSFAESGTYSLRVAPYWSSSGRYTLQLRLRGAHLRRQPRGAHQRVLLDFDGATVDGPALFGRGRSPAILSPLRHFLAGWGLEPEDEPALVAAIVRRVRRHFEALETTGINPSGAEPGGFAVDIVDGSQGPDVFGQENVCRVIVGGTRQELGISTIGIAQFVDPGNTFTRDTAVVLLDLLCGSADDPNSINALRSDGALSKVELVGHVVGAVVAHELGHLLGCWHTRNDNGLPSLIDKGGNLLNTAGAGGDGTLGTGDDLVVGFLADEYASEGIGVGRSWQRVDVRVAFGLSSGTLGSSEYVASLEQELLEATLAAQLERLAVYDRERGLPPSWGGIPAVVRADTEAPWWLPRPASMPEVLPATALPALETVDFWSQRARALRDDLERVRGREE